MTARRTAIPALDSGGSVHQSVWIVVALMLTVVLAPVAAGAVGTLVSISDPSTGAKAHVSDGELHVGDGSGPLTVNGNVNVANLPTLQPIAGTVKVEQAAGAQPLKVQGTVNAIYTATVHVQGTVNSLQGIEPAPWNTFAQGNNQATLTLFDPAAGTTDLAVTSFTVMNTGDVAATVTVELASIVGGICQPNAGGTLTEFSVGPNQSSHIDYPQPLVAHFISGNKCVLAEISGNGTTRITGVGFSQ